jgi:alanine racemase
MSTVPDLDPSTLRPTFAEINLGAFRRNLQSIREMLPVSSRLIAVLKADGYGHGAVELAKVCEEEDVEMIAVALLEEAVALEIAGIQLPILIFGPLNYLQIEAAVARRFVIGVIGPEELDLICEYAEEHQSDVRVHLKLDSGMGRMGIVSSELDRVAAALRAQPRVKLDAIYTHFANASDPRDGFTERQIETFSAMLQRLRELGVDAPLHHAANSAAMVRGLVVPGDYARVGIAMYGAEPLDVGATRLERLLTWKTRVARIKTIGPGEAVGYGTTFKATRDTVVATLPVGYADGYNRLLSNKGAVLIRGRRAPVIGRVSMDLLTVDVTSIPDVTLGDEVVLLGRNGDDEISAEEIANLTGTINYEVFCSISSRVPRVYV